MAKIIKVPILLSNYLEQGGLLKHINLNDVTIDGLKINGISDIGGDKYKIVLNQSIGYYKADRLIINTEMIIHSKYKR